MKLYKKRLAILLASAILSSQVVPVYAVDEKRVVTSQGDYVNHWATQEIEKWIKNEWVSLYGDKTFKPNQNITRGEFVDCVNNAFALPDSEELLAFKDVEQDSKYYTAIANAVALGYINGYEDHTFRPNDPITRQEVAKAIGSLVGLNFYKKDVLEQFKDSEEIAKWADDYVNVLLENEILRGYPDYTFRPTANMTRAEAVKFLENLRNKVTQYTGIYIELFKDNRILTEKTKIQIINNKNKLVYSGYTDKENGVLEVKNFNPGNYKIKVFVDGGHIEVKTYVAEGYTTLEQINISEYDIIKADKSEQKNDHISSGDSSNEGSTVVKPSEPTEPSEPSKPTEPSNPADKEAPIININTVGMIYNEEKDAYLLTETIDSMNGTVKDESEIVSITYEVVSGNLKIGQGALVPRNEWTIEKMPIALGENILTINSKDVHGNESKKSIKIISMTENNIDTSLLDKGDSDQDGLLNYQEDYYGTNPLVVDTDGDGLSDYEELFITATDPLKRDSDNNGITDDQEDKDGDGVINIDEVKHNASPFSPDTDFDDVLDGDEIKLGTKPDDMDTDKDGLTDGNEIKLGTDPLNPDTNDNGIKDGEEIIETTVTCLMEGNESPVIASATVKIQGQQMNTLRINKVSSQDIFLSEDIPGYLGNAYNFQVYGEFEEATLAFEFDPSRIAAAKSESFEPRIYYFNEEEQTLEELPNQEVRGNTVYAKVEHCAKYILLNKVEFDRVWEEEIRAPGSDKVLDIALVIDSSKSMQWNDSNNLRLEAAKGFVDKLGEDDQAAVIEFDNFASLKAAFTNDKEVLHNAIDDIDNQGGTAIYRGLQLALKQFADLENSLGIDHSIDTTFVDMLELEGLEIERTTESNLKLDSDTTTGSALDIDLFDQTDRAAKRVIIILSDGQDSYKNYKYSRLIEEAINKGIMIYTIGLGDEVDEDLLKLLAHQTDAKYYHATSAGDLEDVFDETAGETIDYVTDTDGDGLADYYEKKINNGSLVSGTGKRLEGTLSWDNPMVNDTDGDGLKDGEEIILILSADGKSVKHFIMISDPTKPDTDGDRIADSQDSRPKNWDISDRDLALCASIAYHDIPVIDELNSLSDKWKKQINEGFEGAADISELGRWSVYQTSYGAGFEETGFQGIAFEIDNQVVVALRGSESNDFTDIVEDWIISDAAGWLNGFTIQGPDAKSFMNRIMKDTSGDIYVTGHSLGGNLDYNAGAKAIELDESAVKKINTYNGLGILKGFTIISADTIFNDKQLSSQRDKISNFEIEGDIVCKLVRTSHYGTKKRYANLKPGELFVGAHSLYNFLMQVH